MFEIFVVLFVLACLLSVDYLFMDWFCYKSYLDKLNMIDELYPMGSTERDLAINLVNIWYDSDHKFRLRRARNRKY